MATIEGFRLTDRSPDYQAGHRRAVRACISWLHDRAKQMNDPHAEAILNSAAFSLGVEAKRKEARSDG